MKLGLFSIAYEDVPLESILRHISSLGYESIELPAWKGNPHLDLDKIINGGAQEVKNLVSKYGITISGLNNYIEGHSFSVLMTALPISYSKETKLKNRITE